MCHASQLRWYCDDVLLGICIGILFIPLHWMLYLLMWCDREEYTERVRNNFGAFMCRVTAGVALGIAISALFIVGLALGWFRRV